MTIFAVALSLFLLMDPIGNIPLFLTILKEIDPKRQQRIIFRESLLALLLISTFYFLGEWLLGILGITPQAVRISGGIILFIIAIKLIFPSSNNGPQWSQNKEPFLVPLAMPMIAGPAVLAGVMLYARQNVDHLISLTGIFLAWVGSTIILMCAIPLKKILGQRGITACEKLMGLLLVMLGVQMFLDGIKQFLSI